jgi:hypothetical protein
MAVLSNNGRLIVSLPVAATLQGNDQFIIQSVSNVNPSGVTRRVNYDFIRQDLSDLVISDIENDPTLKLSGSFYTPNGGYANFYTTQIRNGLTVSNGSLIISAGNLTVSSGNTSLQNTTATKFTGPLTGSVRGNLTGNVKSSGTSTFVNISATSLTVNGSMTCFATAALYTVQINGGAINSTQIGQTTPSLLTGTRITGSIGIKSLGKMFVDNDLSVVGTSYLPYISGSNMTASKITSGKIVGNLTGDIFSPTGNKVLENGAGLAKNSRFYGTSSYAGSSSYAITASYAFATVPTNYVEFSLSSSYASASRKSLFTLSSSYASASRKSLFTLSSSYASASNISLTSLTSSLSIKSKFSISNLSSSYASASVKSLFTLSSSYASSSRKSLFTLSSSYASSSRSSSYARTSSLSINSRRSLTSSYVLQNNPNYTYKLTYYDGNSLIPTNDFSLINAGNYRFLYFSGSPDPMNPTSVPPNYYIVADGFRESAYPTSGQACLALSLNINRAQRNANGLPFAYNYGPEAWNFITYDSGSFTIQSYKQSYAFSSSNYYIKTNKTPLQESTFNVAKFINNSIYFWGEPFSYNTAMRDGAIGIGVPSHTVSTGVSSLKARLQIDVFSSSLADRGKGAWTGTAPVRELPALLVRYGSGSAAPLGKTFFVSGSGNTFIGGTLTSSKDVYIYGNLNVNGTITSNTSDNGSGFNYLSNPILLDTISNANVDAWRTIEMSGMTAPADLPLAKSAIVYVELQASSITAGSTAQIDFKYRKDSGDGTKTGCALSYYSWSTSGNFRQGSTIIVPIQRTSSPNSFQIYVDKGGATFTATATVTLVGYLT